MATPGIWTEEIKARTGKEGDLQAEAKATHFASLMRVMRKFWEGNRHIWDSIMLWAACYVGFSDFLVLGGARPSQWEYD